ncbi:hypothetical protein ACIA8R_52380 [Nonomuraea sp. NPDC051191]
MGKQMTEMLKGKGTLEGIVLAILSGRVGILVVAFAFAMDTYRRKIS